jgi:AraC family transcriptional regulator
MPCIDSTSTTNPLPVSSAVSMFPGFSAVHHKIGRPMDIALEAESLAFIIPVNASAELIYSVDTGTERRELLKPNSILIAGVAPIRWKATTAPVDLLELRLSAEVQSRIDHAGWIGADPVHIVEDELFHRIAVLLLPSTAEGGCRNGCVFADNLAATVIAHVDRNYGASSERAVDDSGDRLPASVLRQIHDAIESRLSEPLRVRDLADLARVSEFHFLRAFKRSTGMPPHQYVTGRRIDRAKTLLSTTDLSVAEIAWRVGFSNTSHFNAQFRKHTGATPGAWRDQGAAASSFKTA